MPTDDEIDALLRAAFAELRNLIAASEQKSRATEAPLQEALRKLVAEVGALSAFEHEIMSTIGNTNWSVLQLRLTEAEAVLTAAKGKK